jgi:hypothetical protein
VLSNRLLRDLKFEIPRCNVLKTSALVVSLVSISNGIAAWSDSRDGEIEFEHYEESGYMFKKGVPLLTSGTGA